MGCRMLEIAAMMIRILTISSACLCLCAPAVAAPGGKLGTLPIGEYRCGMPGDADRGAWIPLEDRQFTIGNSSTYQTSDGWGTYLLTGTRLTFTRGPMAGMKFERISSVTLRWIDENGEVSRIRCVRGGAAG